MTIAQTLNDIAADIAKRQAQIATDLPADEEEDEDAETVKGAWMNNLGLADDVLDLAIALHEVIRITQRPRLQKWLTTIDNGAPVVKPEPPKIIQRPAEPPIVTKQSTVSRRRRSRSPVYYGILDYIRNNPGSTQDELSLRFKVHLGTIHHHVKRMMDAGVIVKDNTKRGLAHRYRINDEQAQVAAD